MERLKNKKVYVGKFSKQIQEKAFELGFSWENGKFVQNLNVPFLFFYDRINYTSDLEYFNKVECEEVTSEYILDLEVKNKPEWGYFGKINGYYIDEHSYLRSCTNKYTGDDNRNVFPSREEAEACLALSQLLQWRDKYNEGWKPNWSNDKERKSVISYNDYFLETKYSIKDHYVLAFKTEEIRDKFVDDFRELIQIAIPLL